ncbi:unnamed protein product, partial [Staurois parvus]
VEGLQAVLIIQRKLAYQFPLWFVKPVLGPVAWRFLRDLGGMKSPNLGPYFESSQHDDCTGVCKPFCGGPGHDSGLHPSRQEAMILGSTPADRRSLPWSQVGFT